MKQLMLLLTVLAIISCTENNENIFYTNDPGGDKGSVVGLVLQSDSNAKIIIRQAVPIDSVLINAADGTFRIDSLPAGNYELTIKAANFRTYRNPNVVVNAGGVTYVGEINLSTTPDLVGGFYPDNNSEIVFDRRWSRLSISMHFTTPMDRESVEQALSIDPPAEGIFYWGSFAETPTPEYFWDENKFYDGKGSNLGGEITTFSKVKAFTFRLARKDSYVDTTYTITLSTVAKDTAGNNLRFPLKYKFSTVQSFSSQNAILTTPEHGDIFIDPLDNASIYMTFPRRMDQASVENALSISPATDVIYIWPEHNKLNIYTGGPLKCETIYKISLAESATDLEGLALGEPFEFSFETAPVELESTAPQSGEIFVSKNREIRLRFNTYMIKSSVQSAFQINPHINGTFIRGYENQNGEPKDIITFMPSTNYAPNTKYTVTIGTEAYDLHGTKIDQPYTFSFVTEPD